MVDLLRIVISLVLPAFAQDTQVQLTTVVSGLSAPTDIQNAGDGTNRLFIVEQAGGGASTGRKRVLDIVPDSLHQRVPLIMGSIKNVQRLEHMHTVPDVALEANAPLFGNRGLFRV